MKNTKRLLTLIVLLVFGAALLPGLALAQEEVTCESDMVVQGDDWLSRIADKFYGNPLAFPAIVEATNAKAASDSSYATISDANIIEAGWKLCLPSAAKIQELLAEDEIATTTVQGGSITVVQGPEPLSLDPTVDINKTSINVQYTMFDPLVNNTSDNQLIPWLATSWEAVEPTRWRFTLRQGVTFHNGEPFNAESVVFSLNAYNASKGEGAKLFTFIKGAEAVDEYTVDILTEKPNPIIPRAMAFLLALPPKYYAEKGSEQFALAPVGTGPFTFGEWQTGVQIKVKANPAYWRGAPRLDEVTFKPAPEASTRAALLQTGEADIIANVPPELADQIAKTEGLRVAQTPSLRMIFLEFNPFQPPFDNVKVREAFNYAVDKESLINDILGGYATRIKGVILPGWLGYNPDALTSYDYDPEKAKQLLAEAGYAEGLQVDFWFPIGRYLKDKEVAEAIAGQLQKVGVTLNMQGSDIGTLVERIHTQTLSGLHFFSMAPLIMDPDYLFRTHFYSQGLNQYGWTERTDADIEAASSTVDGAERARIYEALDQYLTNEHIPWVYMYQQNLIYGVNGNLEWNPRSDEIIDLRTAGFKSR
ncbi:MAG: ABC transporter substrate-binding protein [Anaerolineae bacterium]